VPRIGFSDFQIDNPQDKPQEVDLLFVALQFSLIMIIGYIVVFLDWLAQAG